MKTSKDFRLSKETKRLLAQNKFIDNESRSHFKNLMIDAQVRAERASRDNQKGKAKDE